jgi:hypothetical protein
MERVVDPALHGKVKEINGQLATMLADTKRALSGEREFGVDQVQALAALTAPMAPVMARAAKLCQLHPEMTEPLDRYKSLLRELQTAVEKVRMMLLARRSQMDAGRVQLAAVTKWANALGQTR